MTYRPAKSELHPSDVTACIESLLHFAKTKGLLHPFDIYHARNALLYALQMDDGDIGAHVPDDFCQSQTATPYLRVLCQHAVEKGIIQDSLFHREQFAAHIMNLLTPLPSKVIEQFEQIQKNQGIEKATDWFYAFCRSNDSIRVDEIAKNVAFTEDSPYGALEITINLSKPEKDPHEIAKLRNMPKKGYPACMLCLENEGFSGRPGYPSHETLRIIPVMQRKEHWRFQYSPYSYYGEHCIALNEQHVPMRINRRTFSLLLSFVEMFPHYFFGSNADLPIVGGSILNHDHFQGGRHVFPMDLAKAQCSFSHPAFPDISIEHVRWPMTCIRLVSKNPDSLSDIAEIIRETWQCYSNPARGILHQTDHTPHNTVTPIARRIGKRYLMHIVLRNNRTTDEHPYGLFHPHEDLHHIKRENIGLIEVMGLFILPGRLQSELSGLEDLLAGKRFPQRISTNDTLAKHAVWARELIESYGIEHSNEEAKAILRKELSKKCARVLEDAGVFKLTPEGIEGMRNFMNAAGFLCNG